jgi:pimeloyl-ACP methyl ester carboxylesterase
MPKILINGLEHYYELSGHGPALVFVHGAFADARMWDSQWGHFISKYRVLRYDLRGHGRTGSSGLAAYSMATFADDLSALLERLEFVSPVICGQSWGGSIAQAFAVRRPGQLRGLVLAGSMVAIDLTLLDKFLCNFLFPRWAMLFAIRTLSVESFTRFSFRLARLSLGKHWLSRDPDAQAYLEQCMFGMDSNEYLKIWQAMYAFHLLPLEKIACPTLVLNGEFESRNLYRHAQAILRCVPHAEARVVPSALHGMNLENPHGFNGLLDDFLHRIP